MYNLKNIHVSISSKVRFLIHIADPIIYLFFKDEFVLECLKRTFCHFIDESLFKGDQKEYEKKNLENNWEGEWIFFSQDQYVVGLLISRNCFIFPNIIVLGSRRRWLAIKVRIAWWSVNLSRIRSVGEKRRGHWSGDFWRGEERLSDPLTECCLRADATILFGGDFPWLTTTSVPPSVNLTTNLPRKSLRRLTLVNNRASKWRCLRSSNFLTPNPLNVIESLLSILSMKGHCSNVSIRYTFS